MYQYQKLTKLVVNGQRAQFEEFILREKSSFILDDTWPLVEQLKSIVLINGAKRLGHVYSNISEDDLLGKLGVSK